MSGQHSGLINFLVPRDHAEPVVTEGYLEQFAGLHPHCILEAWTAGNARVTPG